MELKSRFWIQSDEYMLYSEKEEDDYTIYYENNRLNVMWYNPSINYIEGGEIVETEGLQAQESIQMIYINLKDKNGKEIYEGDICKSYEYYIHEVKYINGSFGYETDNGFISMAQNAHFKWTNSRSDKIEVIGNIYQNPELLK